MRLRAAIIVFAFVPLLGQTFDVASVRHAGPADNNQRSWGDAGGRVVLRGVTLAYVIREAFDLQLFQLHGPTWIDTERYDILATAPSGTPRLQIMRMLQNLLTERFQIASHREQEEASVYLLTLRPGAPEFKVAAMPDSASVDPAPRIQIDGGTPGFKINDPLRGPYRVTPDSFGLHYAFDAITLDGLERILNQSYLDRPVLNRTALDGVYRLTLDVPFPASAAGTDPSGYSVERSLESQGLELRRGRAQVEKLVIDRVSKDPTEN